MSSTFYAYLFIIIDWIELGKPSKLEAHQALDSVNTHKDFCAVEMHPEAVLKDNTKSEPQYISI